MSTPAFNNLLAAARAAFERGAQPGGHFTRLKAAIDAVEREAAEPPCIEAALYFLIDRARREGKVITVETVSDPHAPAMGRYWMRGHVRPARHAQTPLPALVPPQSAEDFVRMLLWDEFPECCGKGATTDHGILGVEHHCCGEPEPALLNDAQIVASLRERFPAPKASGIVIPPRVRRSPPPSIPAAQVMQAALQDIGEYTGEGPMTADWQGMVRRIGTVARGALAAAQSDFEQVQAMSESQIDAALRAHGIDSDTAARDIKAAIERGCLEYDTRLKNPLGPRGPAQAAASIKGSVQEVPTPDQQQAGVRELRNPYWNTMDYARVVAIWNAMRAAAPIKTGLDHFIDDVEAAQAPRPHEVHRCIRCGYLQGHAADCPTQSPAQIVRPGSVKAGDGSYHDHQCPRLNGGDCTCPKQGGTL